MIRAWTKIRSEIVTENRIFTLKTRVSRAPGTDREHEFYLLEAGDWVNVIPVTPSGEIVLVRQYRHGTEEVTLEIPGGMVEPGQTPDEAARRELVEETGYLADSLTCLGRVRPNPAILNNWCYSFLAENVFPGGEKEPDETEDLETVVLPLAEVRTLLADGGIDHALVLAAFYFFFTARTVARVIA